MHRATIEIRLTRLKTLMNSVNVPKGFTITYNGFSYNFKVLKKNLDAMEHSTKMLLGNNRERFKYYNEWYKVLSKIYLKQNETI